MNAASRTLLSCLDNILELPRLGIDDNRLFLIVVGKDLWIDSDTLITGGALVFRSILIRNQRQWCYPYLMVRYYRWLRPILSRLLRYHWLPWKAGSS